MSSAYKVKSIMLSNTLGAANRMCDVLNRMRNDRDCDTQSDWIHWILRYRFLLTCGKYNCICIAVKLLPVCIS